LKEKNIFHFVIILILFLSVNLIFHFTQNRIILNDGKGIDGAEYYETAKQFSEGKPVSGNAPLVYRLGTPFLASIIDKDDLLSGFFYANLIANFLSCFLLFSALKIYIKNFYINIFLILLYLLHPLCNTRYIYFCPVLTDAWGLVFLLAGIILLEKIRTGKSGLYILLFSALSFTGVLFREYILILPLSLLFVSNPFGKNYFFCLSIKKMFSKGIITLVPLAAAIAGIILTHSIAANNDVNHSFLKTTFYFFYEKSLFQYVYAWFVAIGPVIAVIIFFHKDVFKFLNENQHYLFLIFCSIVLSFIGGTDSRRIILWFIPVILLIEGFVIENNLPVFKKIFFIFPLILFQGISMKVFTQISEPVRPEAELGVPIMPVLGDSYFLNLISPLGDLRFEFVSFIKYILAIGFLLLLLRYFYFGLKNDKNEFN
jgi:hypothetical protein